MKRKIKQHAWHTGNDGGDDGDGCDGGDIDGGDVNGVLRDRNDNNNRVRLGNISGSLEGPGISFSLASASAEPSSTHTDGAPNLYNAVTNKNMTFST